MSLPARIYKTMENVAGAENISDRPHILAAYRHTSPQGMGKPPSPEAVIMPGSTEEVRSIVKICIEQGVKYSAITSLFGSGVTGPGTVIISLRRMNKIIEINEEDRYVVVEPGVRHVQLKPELMKRGLTYPVPSVGPSCSVMANFLGKGEHHIQFSTSKNNRYLLGYEWISPTGDIIRTGSLIGGAGWFSPDGPGPSLGGLIVKGNGIYTKAAIGLDAWRGPPVMPAEGRSPDYKVRLPQDCHKVFIFKFPDLDKVRDFMVEMGKAEIGIGVLKFFYATAAVMFTVSANDFWELWNSGLFQRELPLAVWVYLATWSKEELAYEERVTRDIVEEMEGEEVAEEVGKRWEDNMDFFILVSFLQRVLKLGGGWRPVIHSESLAQTIDIAKSFTEYFHRFVDEGLILNAPYNYQIIPIEYGHAAHIELLFFYDRTIPERRRIPMEIYREAQAYDIEHGYYMSPPPGGAAEDIGELYSNYNIWMNKVREAFTPDKK